MKSIQAFFSGILFTGLLVTQTAFCQQNSSDKIPQSIPELRQELERLMDYHGVPALGVTLVEGDSIIWSDGLGLANKADSIPADGQTMFRIGSISKMFVSLSILKLQEEGKVSLLDQVKELVPEIEFENPWSETNPILVQHLLEHTTGWDDIHITEYALDAKDMTLKEGLDYHPHSRRSRWVPGTRTSYCNSGPPVAAYIVEKISGMTFEDYVQQNFFDPMDMENMTYFESPDYQLKGATLYEGNQPQPYWNIIMRPSGSINSTPSDMGKFVRFFVNRGWVDSLQLISFSSMARMETPTSNLGSQAGLEIGYGLSNYTSNYNGFTYQGHNGGVNGGSSELAYLPEQRVGYAFMINTAGGSGYSAISDLIRSYQTRNLQPTKPKQETLNDADLSDMEGYYRQINPRIQLFYFISKLTEVNRFWQDSDTLKRKPLIGGNESSFLPLSTSKFIGPETGRVALVSTDDPLAGQVVYLGTTVYEPVPAFIVFGNYTIMGLWILAIISSGILFFVWLVQLLNNKLSKGANLWMRIWPILSSAIMTTCIILFMAGAMDPFRLFGAPSFVSVSLFVLTIAYAAISLWSVVYLLKAYKLGVNKKAYWYLIVVSFLHVTASGYLFMHDLIGVMTWN